jgi:hypothetical protein
MNSALEYVLSGAYGLQWSVLTEAPGLVTLFFVG